MKLKTIQRSVLPIGVTVGVILAEQLSTRLKAWLTEPGAAVMLSAVVIAASIELVKFFAETLFDHWRFLRRVLLGDQYLEGTWFDIMRVAGKPSEVGLSWISYDDWEINYAGEDYDLKYDSDSAGVAMTHRFPYTAETIADDRLDLRARVGHAGLLPVRDQDQVAFAAGTQVNGDRPPRPRLHSLHACQSESQSGPFGFRPDRRSD
jgi:hypothetical protein